VTSILEDNAASVIVLYTAFCERMVSLFIFIEIGAHGTVIRSC